MRVYTFEQIYQLVWKDYPVGDIKNIIWCLVKMCIRDSHLCRHCYAGGDAWLHPHFYSADGGINTADDNEGEAGNFPWAYGLLPNSRNDKEGCGMEKKRTYGVWAVRSSTSIFGPAQSWCKENGKPLEFDTKAAAENYAKEANEHTTANVRYYVKEKEPEPGAVRKGTSQPELDARSHEEVIPRNDAAEKQNEIPGRQIPSQTDPLVEIRSAVHSNYAGMVAMLGADNRVYLGREERCHYQNMQPSYYDNQDGSLCFVCDQPDMYYFLYGEGWAHTQAEMLERGLTLRQYEEFARLQNGVLAQFTTQREILFAGQPFQAPESYLRNAELYEEGQTGNYNMLDGRLNNEPPVRPDLTDGQTDEEIRELVPEAKPSLMDRLTQMFNIFWIAQADVREGEEVPLSIAYTPFMLYQTS